MDFIFEVCKAMLLVAAAVIALSLATFLAYATVVIIKASADDKKKIKSNAKKGKK